MSRKVNYGRPLLRCLVQEANEMGISVDFHIDKDGRYVIKTPHDINVPPTAASACFFVKGMIALAEVKQNSLFPESR